MRRVVSALPLTFLALAMLAGWPAGIAAQEVSPDLAERLRAAVERRQDDGTLAAELAATRRLEPAELDELAAPVALYPDALLAQVLTAATYPDQVARAGEIVAAGETMTDAELEQAIGAEDWDPSVLALLSGFPTVIARMAEDIDWTTELGAAMLHQDDGVLAAVQRLRAEAQAAGNLSSNAAQIVERDADVIAIRPAKPDVVYVPDYDPDVVYSTRQGPAPVYVPPQPAPGLPVPEMLVSGAVGFGAGFLVNELLNDDDDNGGNGGGKGWKDYWRRDQAIDWRERRFYPRPQRDRDRRDWRAERDRYWDRDTGRWRRDDDLRRRDADERRMLAPWMVPAESRDRARSDRELRAWREKARQEARIEARDAARRAERRERREEARREEDRRAAARQEQRRDAQRKEERREEAVKAKPPVGAAAREESKRKAAASQERAEKARVEARREEARRAAERKAERAQARKEAERKAERAQERKQAEKAAKRKEERPAAAVGTKPRPDDKAKAEPARKPKAGDDGDRKKAQAPRKEEPKRKPPAKKCGPDDNRKACRDG